MYRQILIPVQEASEVEPLIRFAAMLLDADGEIRVLHVIQMTSLPQVTREWRESVRLAIPAHEAGAALDVRVDPSIRASADVPGEILDSQESHDIDAILMTLRGNKRSRNPFVGHTSSAILQHAHCDVLIINRLAMVADAIPRILLPTFAENPAPKAMRVAEEIALHNDGAPIVTFSIAARGQEDSESRERSERSPRGVPMTHKYSFISRALLGRRTQLPDLIVRHATREGYGLLLVGEEAVQPEGPLLTRRFIEQLFRAAPGPVMALRS
jgi:nucleotide-binding universal stress UspA family protein